MILLQHEFQDVRYMLVLVNKLACVSCVSEGVFAPSACALAGGIYSHDVRTYMLVKLQECAVSALLSHFRNVAHAHA